MAVWLRRHPWWIIILVWCLLTIDTASAPLQAGSGSAKVSSVASNGDIHLSNGVKLRLMGIDLPSTWECYGDNRLRYMQDKLVDNMVRYTVEKRDLMGKSLAYVSIYGDVADDLISEGYGFALRSFSYDKKDYYLRMEAAAKRQKKGLWGKCDVDCDDRGCETESAIFSCGG